MKSNKLKKYSLKRFLLLVVSPAFLFSFYIFAMKLSTETENFNPVSFLIVCLFGSILILFQSLPFLLLFAFIMEKLYVLDYLKNKLFQFFYGGIIGIFTIWIFTVQKIWFPKSNYDLFNIKLLFILFFVHAITSLFIYRNK